MYLWYGYSMEILAFGHDSTGSSGAIAAGCKGTVIDGSCYLDEFLKHIQKVGANSAAWTGMIPGVGPNMFPDVFDTAAELSSSTYSNNHDAQKLFPHAGLSHSPAFSAVYQLVTDRIQLCRQQLGDGELRQELNGIRQAMIMVHDTRVADHAKTCIDGVNDMLDQKGIKWVSQLVFTILVFVDRSSLDTESHSGERSVTEWRIVRQSRYPEDYRCT